MKPLAIAGLAFSTLATVAQSTNFNQIQHIETSLNHLTVIDLGEAVTMLALADQDSFQIERQGDKVLLRPLREGVSTNLFIWTATRQLSYELDPAGDLSKMNVVVRNLLSASGSSAVPSQSTEDPSDEEIRKIANLVLQETMLGTQAIAHDSRPPAGQVQVQLQQVFRSKDALYVRYSVLNATKEPFRLTTPSVYNMVPSQQPVSLLNLRNRQLEPQIVSAFRVTGKSSWPISGGHSLVQDLAPGAATAGVVEIKSGEGNPPQLFELNFGNEQNRPVIVHAVL